MEYAEKDTPSIIQEHPFQRFNPVKQY